VRGVRSHPRPSRSGEAAPRRAALQVRRPAGPEGRSDRGACPSNFHWHRTDWHPTGFGLAGAELR
jgi:hypothetical protein